MLCCRGGGVSPSMVKSQSVCHFAASSPRLLQQIASKVAWFDARHFDIQTSIQGLILRGMNQAVEDKILDEFVLKQNTPSPTSRHKN